MSWDWMNTPEKEIAMIHYLMTDADKLRHKVEPSRKAEYEYAYKVYKRALWDALRAKSLSIHNLRSSDVLE